MALPRPAGRLPRWWCLLAALAPALLPVPPAWAAEGRGGLLGRVLQHPGDVDDDESASQGSVHLPEGVRVLRDQAYGPGPRQRLDVYLPPPAAAGAPPAAVLFLVHGGAWRTGDKAHARFVQGKLTHWAAQGVVIVSVGYGLLPDTPVAGQVQDVAAALAWVQTHAGAWGADPQRVLGMGHSAGAHLVALLAAGHPARTAAGAGPWRGAVLLDSAILDVPRLMGARHLPLYDAAFGREPAAWPALSPLHQLQAAPAPVLAVCSTRRLTSCQQADAFGARVQALGGQARVLREDLSHLQINAQLGDPGDYTRQVDLFVAGVLGLPAP